MATEGKPSGSDGATGWTKVDERPERWEHRGLGAVVERGADLWSFLPICGHDYYAASNRADAQALAERRSGLCFVCWDGTTQQAVSATWTVPVGPLQTQLGSTSEAARQPALVLVVDDDLDIREALAEALEGNGYSVVGAANGAEAFDLLRSRAVPQVILLDLMMPLMDGYRFRAQQRKDPALAAIPVIVITAGTSVRNAELDAVAVLRKPLDLSQLLTTIDQHCSC